MKKWPSKERALEKYSVAAFYYLSGKRGVAALEKYSLAAFYYLGGKRGVAALEKYSLAAFYYLGGKTGVDLRKKINWPRGPVKNFNNWPLQNSPGPRNIGPRSGPI